MGDLQAVREIFLPNSEFAPAEGVAANGLSFG
jgi:hypothetical protein